MNHLHEKFSHVTRTVRLSSEEKRMLWARIRAKTGAPIQSPYYAPFLMRLGSVLLIVLLIGGGTSVAAEGALPGDTLYPFKVGVTEPARDALAFSDEAKASWNTEVVVRRVKEAQTLAANANLTEKAEASIEASLAQRAEKAAHIAKKIEARDPEAAERLAMEFDISLEAHSEILEELGDGSGSEDTLRASRGLATHLREGTYRFWSVSVNDGPVAVARKSEGNADTAAQPEATSMMMVAIDDSADVAPQAKELSLESEVVVSADVIEEDSVSDTVRARAGKSLEKTQEAYESVKEHLVDESKQRIEAALYELETRIDASTANDTFRDIFRELTRLRTYLEAAERFEKKGIIESFLRTRGAATIESNIELETRDD